MSADAKQWKKDLLREKGAVVVEHKADYEKAVATGRLEAEKDPFAYFVDDEQSEALFIGYATAALRLKTQLEKAGVEPSVDKPLYVYLPCGIGGGPGGVAYGLNLLYGQAVQCFFAEPVESPCMLLGLATGRHDRISVYDIGLTNKTIADGLAVGRPSRFAGERVAPFIGGAYTVKDKQLLKLMALMAQAENIKIEPSAAAGLMGPVLIDAPKQATHLIWATGGSMVPESVMNEEINRGRTLPDSVLQLNAAKA